MLSLLCGCSACVAACSASLKPDGEDVAIDTAVPVLGAGALTPPVSSIASGITLDQFPDSNAVGLHSVAPVSETPAATDVSLSATSEHPALQDATPIVTGNDLQTSLASQTYAASALFSVNGAYTSLAFKDGPSLTGSGYFVLDGVRETSAFTIAASQLSELTYVSPIVGTDLISIIATDGSIVGNSGVAVVEGPQAEPPSVTVQDGIVTYGGSRTIAMSSLIYSIADNNGLPLSDITINLDDQGAVNLSPWIPVSGYFDVNGVDEGRYVSGLTLAQLAETTYVSTAPYGADTINVVVSDGETYETSQYFTITSDGPTTPEISSFSQTGLTAGEEFGGSVADLVSVCDPLGVTAAEQIYTLSYSGTGGVLFLRGVAEPTGTSLTLSGIDLANLLYETTPFGGTDQITVDFSNG
jgi:hypothetical protein